jgi:phospholipase C
LAATFTETIPSSWRADRPDRDALFSSMNLFSPVRHESAMSSFYSAGLLEPLPPTEKKMRRISAATFCVALILWSLVFPAFTAAGVANAFPPSPRPTTATPIKHLVVIFQENESFDHYFGTYPKNDSSEPPFNAAPNTPAVNGLTPTLLTNNPNKAVAGNPFLLTREQAATCDNTNKYTPEQEAFDGGLLDMFNLLAPSAKTAATCGGSTGFYLPPNLEMGYYTGNTVTALWNYAQHYAMSDNFFDTEFGGTVEGHLNLLSGQTNGLAVGNSTLLTTSLISNNTVINNVQPANDDCAASNPPTITMTGHNVGDLLNKAGVTWGWFYDGFRSNGNLPGNPATCGNPLYNSHYAPFGYWASTSNPHHLAPTSAATIGTTDPANHNYDLSDLWEAVAANNLPAVTFIKGSSLETGHPMDSTPLEEQTFLVNTINKLEESPEWNEMAIIVAWDDSDGWYDHVAGPIVNHSTDNANDGIQGAPSKGTGSCGALGTGADNDRCGFGPRLPFLVISPYAKQNYVDHSLNDTTSILRFIEYNWSLGAVGSLGISNDLQSFDVMASGSILGMFDFNQDDFLFFPQFFPNRRLILNPSSGGVSGWY